MAINLFNDLGESGGQRNLTLIKPSSFVTRHPNPFASKNIYYDERWVEKQENGFKKWLNFVLTPDCLDNEENNEKMIDTVKLWKACTMDNVARAPTREALSVRTLSVRREMNRLRKNACKLWQTPGIAKVIRKVEIEIEKKVCYYLIL